MVLAAGAVLSPGAPRISEFLADNATGIRDEDGDREDWIEIHNPDGVSVNLSGWSLTDKSSHDAPWVFPPVVLGPGERLVVFASKKDRRDPASPMHTDFSLKKSGEYLALLDPSGTAVSEYSPEFPEQLPDVSYGVASAPAGLLGDEAALSYHVPVADIGDSWRGVSFSDPDGHFISTGDGGAPLHPGIGRDESGGYLPLIKTGVPAGSAGVYVRIPFRVVSPASLTSLTLSMAYDDAFVAWINGVEVARSSGAPPVPEWDSVSSVHHDAKLDDPAVFDISAHLGRLVSGDNVLAIHVLDRSEKSGDLLADPRLDATRGSSVGNFLYPPTPGAPNGPASLPGPEISGAEQTPALPGDSDAIAVAATVSPVIGTVGSVKLFYRVNDGGETSVEMSDLGGVHSATIPAAAATPGDLVRWRIEAADTAGRVSREPAWLDQSGVRQSAKYRGTVIADPAVSGSLPVYEWFAENEAACRTWSGGRASLFYDGVLYDNIFVRRRPGSADPGAQSFLFNRGESFQYDPAAPKVSEIFLASEAGDTTRLRQPVAFAALAQRGGIAPRAFPVNLRLNGADDRVAMHIERIDDDFFKSRGLPQNGALYQFIGRADSRPALNDSLTGIKKLARRSEGTSDLESLIGGLKGSLAGGDLESGGSLLHTPAETAAREVFLFDNLNVPEFTNYLAATILTRDAGDIRENFQLYRDSAGSGEWYIFPGEMDRTFGLGPGADGASKHPFWGDAGHKDPDGDQWSVLLDAVHNSPRVRAMILRRARTLMDELYTESAGGPGAWFEAEAARLESAIDPVLEIDTAPLLAEFAERRADLYFNLYGPGGAEPLIPAAQTPGLALEFGRIEYNPPSGDQDHEFIELRNPNGEDLDISGWSLSGGVEFTFAAGTVVRAGESVWITPRLSAFRTRDVSPTGGEGRMALGPYSGHLSNFGETLTLRDSAGVMVAETAYEGAPSAPQLHLVVSEFHYHPETEPDAEFIELLNISDTVTLDLDGVKFSAGVEFAFAGSAVTTLAPGERVLVVRDPVAFKSVYGTEHAARIAGVFANGTSLSNSGEEIRLDDATNSTIREFTYSDSAPWPTSPDGGGPSLVLRDPTSAPDPNDAANWTVGPSGGTPGYREEIPFDAWLADRGQTDPEADPDGDGWTELENYVLAGDLRPRPGALVAVPDAGGLMLKFIRRDAPDARVVVELSLDLESWGDGIEGLDYEIVSDIPNGDGTRGVSVRMLPGTLGNPTGFARLRSRVVEP